jgi:uncharacterized small protein (DUF1192 family)
MHEEGGVMSDLRELVLNDMIDNLRKEIVRLKAEARGSITNDAANALLKLKNSYFEENKRLLMQLADVLSHNVGVAELMDELEFCKRELRRLDPRLAKARWGI